MIALLMQVDLSTTHGTVEALRRYIAERSVPKYREAEGLRLKVFLSDEAGDTFGALYLWESEAALEAALPSLGSSVRERWGGTPRLQRFEVEAIVEGRHATPDLSRIGRAMEVGSMMASGLPAAGKRATIAELTTDERAEAR